jgi:hypothetical protein
MSLVEDLEVDIKKKSKHKTKHSGVNVLKMLK